MGIQPLDLIDFETNENGRPYAIVGLVVLGQHAIAVLVGTTCPTEQQFVQLPFSTVQFLLRMTVQDHLAHFPMLPFRRPSPES